MTAAAIGRVALVAWTILALAGGVQAESAAAVPRFDAALQRPLFSPTRRPPPPAMPAPSALAPLPPPVAPPPNLTLSGVIVGAGGGVALLRRPVDVAPARVARGAQVDGWTVAEIHPRSVVLRRDARSITVDLSTSAR